MALNRAARAGVRRERAAAATRDARPAVEPLEARRLLAASAAPTRAAAGAGATSGRHAAAAAVAATAAVATAPRPMENLDRGVVAVRGSNTQIFVSWRLLGLDPAGIGFNLYRSANAQPPVKLNASVLTGGTNFTDTAAATGLDFTKSNAYFVRPVVGGVEQPASSAWALPAGAPVRQYVSIPYKRDAGEGPILFGHVATGDLDGDGEYDFVTNHSDGAPTDPGGTHAASTSTVKIEGYRRDGTRLWRIDLGWNVEIGRDYAPMQVYDLDGDGVAEIITHTAEGTRDGTGAVIGDTNADGITDYRDGGGRVLSGPTFVSVFSGKTGRELARANWIPIGNVGDWGDTSGNRASRHLLAVAALDGQRPSIVVCRGVYGLMKVQTWNFNGPAADGSVAALAPVWSWSNQGVAALQGQGFQNIKVADVDGDGRDELLHGSICLDDDGTLKYSLGLGHGDQLNVSDMDPDRPGLEVFSIYEESRTPGIEMHDAATGALIWGKTVTADTARGNSADIDPRTRGYESWAAAGINGVYDARGNQVSTAKPFNDFDLWWDGDRLREMATDRSNGLNIEKWNHTAGTMTGLLNTGAGFLEMCGSGDVMGDWREEIFAIYPASNEFRIYTTTIATSVRTYTLMHDPVYRLSQLVQPQRNITNPQPGFYFGDGMADAPRPNIVYADRNVGRWYQAEQAQLAGGTVAEGSSGGFNGIGYANLPQAGGSVQFNAVDGGPPANASVASHTMRTIRLRYALGGTASRTGRLIVNGIAIPITFAPTGGFAAWSLYAINVPLAPGAANTIRVESTGQDLANIDELQVDITRGAAQITGSVFHDFDDDGAFDAGETLLPGTRVFLDWNGNARYDQGEAHAAADAAAAYAFDALPNDVFNVRVTPPGGFVERPRGATPVADGARNAAVAIPLQRFAYAGTAGSDDYRVAAKPGTAGPGGGYEIFINGTRAYALFAGIPSLTFDLLGGADVLTIDSANGNPFPGGVLTFAGGDGDDRLALLGTAGADRVDFTPATVTSGALIVAHAGVQEFTFDGRGAWDDVSVSGGGPALTLRGIQQLQSLALAAGTVAKFALGAQPYAVVRNLAIAAGAALDLGDTDLLIDYSGASPIGAWSGSRYGGITGMIADGRNAGAWDGAGIRTSAADPNGGLTTLAVAEAADLVAFTPDGTGLWNGATVDATTILVRHTWAGDANLDGLVDGGDYAFIDAFVGAAGSALSYLHGDFNYDGAIDGGDYAYIDVTVGSPPM